MSNKPQLQLSEQDGNAFFIIGRAVGVARRSGWSEDEINKFREDAMSGDYDHVLQTCFKYFDVQ